ncbi:hypothetical protein ACT6QH_10045 [Xanthobacter sp. TB0139]|uniref:hypothetical protein n=1 Tax=Xanthobacter sp. TB0139 TaxID=3459178 RepID=UPI004039FA79
MTTQIDKTLPAAFAELAPFSGWVLPTQDERQQKRYHSTTQELRAFYDAILPRMPEILDYVDQYPLGQIPTEAKPIFWMALSLAEVAPHVELYRGTPKVPYSFDEGRFVAEHGKVPA